MSNVFDNTHLTPDVIMESIFMPADLQSTKTRAIAQIVYMAKLALEGYCQHDDCKLEYAAMIFYTMDHLDLMDNEMGILVGHAVQSFCTGDGIDIHDGEKAINALSDKSVEVIGYMIPVVEKYSEGLKSLGTTMSDLKKEMATDGGESNG